MALIMIGNFGTNVEGITTFRINGDKEDLYQILEEAKKMGYKFWDTPNIVKAHKTWSVLLKIYEPTILGYPDES